MLGSHIGQKKVLRIKVIEIDMRALKKRGLGHVVRVKMSGDACNHTHEWQLLGLNMGLNGNF